MAMDMKACEAVAVVAEAVPITAELIQDADAKLYDDAPVAAVCDAAPADEKHCIALEAKELDVRCLLYTSPSPRDQRGSRMPSSA